MNPANEGGAKQPTNRLAIQESNSGDDVNRPVDLGEKDVVSTQELASFLQQSMFSSTNEEVDQEELVAGLMEDGTSPNVYVHENQLEVSPPFSFVQQFGRKASFTIGTDSGDDPQDESASSPLLLPNDPGSPPRGAGNEDIDDWTTPSVDLGGTEGAALLQAPIIQIPTCDVDRADVAIARDGSATSPSALPKGIASSPTRAGRSPDDDELKMPAVPTDNSMEEDSAVQEAFLASNDDASSHISGKVDRETRANILGESFASAQPSQSEELSVSETDPSAVLARHLQALEVTVTVANPRPNERPGKLTLVSVG